MTFNPKRYTIFRDILISKAVKMTTFMYKIVICFLISVQTLATITIITIILYIFKAD